MHATLQAKIRDIKKQKPNALRTHGEVPAVLYGHGIQSMHLVLNYQEFAKVFEKAGETQLVTLNIGEEKAPRNVLIHDIDTDALSRRYLHVDLYQVRMDEKISADIPLRFIRDSEAVKTLGGVLVKNVHEIKVRALPADLPSELEADISLLKTFEDKIHASNIKMPKGVELIGNPGEIIALVTPPRTEEEIAALAGKVEEDLSAIKVPEKEKKEVEAETAPEAQKSAPEKPEKKEK